MLKGKRKNGGFEGEPILVKKRKKAVAIVASSVAPFSSQGEQKEVHTVNFGNPEDELILARLAAEFAQAGYPDCLEPDPNRVYMVTWEEAELWVILAATSTGKMSVKISRKRPSGIKVLTHGNNLDSVFGISWLIEISRKEARKKVDEALGQYGLGPERY